NLHRAAQEVVARFGGEFPRTFDALATLPGIGRSTAAAIAAFSSGEPRAILDGNVKRVIARHAGVAGDPSTNAVLARPWSEADAAGRRRGVHAGHDGPRRRRVLAEEARVPRLPRGARLRRAAGVARGRAARPQGAPCGAPPPGGNARGVVARRGPAGEASHDR